jgi:hypothetical protein
VIAPGTDDGVSACHKDQSPATGADKRRQYGYPQSISGSSIAGPIILGKVMR